MAMKVWASRARSALERVRIRALRCVAETATGFSAVWLRSNLTAPANNAEMMDVGENVECVLRDSFAIRSFSACRRRVPGVPVICKPEKSVWQVYVSFCGVKTTPIVLQRHCVLLMADVYLRIVYLPRQSLPGESLRVPSRYGVWH